jgi:hypothetical protein
MVFGLSSSGPYGSPAIICHRSKLTQLGMHENRNKRVSKVSWVLGFLIRLSIQNGGGTVMKKIVIMTSPITSLAIIPPRFPIKLPQPARTNHRPDKQSDDSEKDADHCTEESADHSPFCCSKIFCAKVAAQKIERVRREGQQSENDDAPPTDAFLRTEHYPVNDRACENEGRSWKYWQHRADKTDGEEHNREQPPKKFHGIRES